MKNQNSDKFLNYNNLLSIQSKIFDWIGLLVNTLILCAIVFSFFIFGVKVSGSSMLPTLHNGDYLFCIKFLYTPQRGDVVIINNQNLIGKNLVKRIIAKENDSIEMDFKKGRVYVNGKLLNEKYINTPTNLESNWKFPKTVPQGKLFVLGDNRNNSLDSRFSVIGLIDKQDILGKATFVMLPLNRIGFLNSQ